VGSGRQIPYPGYLRRDWTCLAGRGTEQQEKKRSSRSTKGTETRQQETQQEATQNTMTVSNEIGVEAVFFPMLQFIERRGLNLLKGERQRCAVFEQRYVFANPPGGSVTRRGSPTSRSLEFHSGGNVINLPAGQPYSYATEAELIFGVPDTSFKYLLGLEAYAQVVDRAVRILLTRFNATPGRPPKVCIAALTRCAAGYGRSNRKGVTQS